MLSPVVSLLLRALAAGVQNADKQRVSGPDHRGHARAQVRPDCPG